MARPIPRLAPVTIATRDSLFEFVLVITSTPILCVISTTFSEQGPKDHQDVKGVHLVRRLANLN